MAHSVPSGDSYGALTGPFGAIEPNVVIAGLEAAAAAWVTYAACQGVPLAPSMDVPWRWSFAIAAIGALLGIVLLGLATEGVAGALEYLVTRPLWGPDKGKLYGWYRDATEHPDQSAWRAAQRWIWKSEQTSLEFSRRRTRILVSRNTTAVLLLQTLALAIVVLARHPPHPVLWLGIDLLCGAAAVVLFGWVWVRANFAYHRAVSDANAIGPP